MLKFITVFTLWLILCKIEHAIGDESLKRLRAEIALKKIYWNFVTNFNTKLNGKEDTQRDFVAQLKNFARERLETEKLNNYWKLRHG